MPVKRKNLWEKNLQSKRFTLITPFTKEKIFSAIWPSSVSQSCHKAAFNIANVILFKVNSDSKAVTYST